ncbi:lysophospholipid acyltransferase family protein [Pseudodesulfovibrio piezophilus]|uniref:DUF374 domain-containing protein n=1 Tax=Pseudodesulfovibrio piezophilus (strain DSM 21447 / JCM 15486 / C1TLV30) TaxID=1322246 RepID=M1WLD6_PSEP2|nr:lysophospholipid acyltransferase family protein [Pseudodesulfovibrio piezophilus]CCH47680.1 conserved protein of unknown function [Pseudodesulfovibrio piezophilus C1TLV30]
MKIPINPTTFSPLVAFLFKLWAKTLRFEVHGDLDSLIAQNKTGKSYVIALWHGELFPIVAFSLGIAKDVFPLISQSKDGEFIARIFKTLGFVTVRGSSSRGGVKALLQAKRIMEKENKMAVVTVDGPRGPRHKSKDGVIFMAQRAKAQIVPVRAYPVTRKVFSQSWDHFLLPLPFSRCPIYIGEPMPVTDRKLDKGILAQEKNKLEKELLFLKPK